MVIMFKGDNLYIDRLAIKNKVSAESLMWYWFYISQASLERLTLQRKSEPREVGNIEKLAMTIAVWKYKKENGTGRYITPLLIEVAIGQEVSRFTIPPLLYKYHFAGMKPITSINKTFAGWQFVNTANVPTEIPDWFIGEDKEKAFEKQYAYIVQSGEKHWWKLKNRFTYTLCTTCVMLPMLVERIGQKYQKALYKVAFYNEMLLLVFKHMPVDVARKMLLSKWRGDKLLSGITVSEEDIARWIVRYDWQTIVLREEYPLEYVVSELASVGKKKQQQVLLTADTENFMLSSPTIPDVKKVVQYYNEIYAEPLDRKPVQFNWQSPIVYKIKEMLKTFSVEDFKKAFEIAVQNPLLSHQIGKHPFNLYWLVENEGNMYKVLDGYYDDVAKKMLEDAEKGKRQSSVLEPSTPQYYWLQYLDSNVRNSVEYYTSRSVLLQKMASANVSPKLVDLILAIAYGNHDNTELKQVAQEFIRFVRQHGWEQARKETRFMKLISEATRQNV